MCRESRPSVLLQAASMTVFDSSMLFPSVRKERQVGVNRFGKKRK